MKTQFSLDTSSFAGAANSTKALAEALEKAITTADNAINDLYSVWSGKGRNEFEKKYKIFEQQVSDIRTGLWDLYEDIVTAEEGYIQADTDAAKQIDGRQEGVLGLNQYDVKEE